MKKGEKDAIGMAAAAVVAGGIYAVTGQAAEGITASAGCCYKS